MITKKYLGAIGMDKISVETRHSMLGDLTISSKEYLKKYNLDDGATRFLDVDRIQMLPKLPNYSEKHTRI
jgi:hypothetical protein